MSQPKHALVKDLFLQAISLDTVARLQLLEEHCADDTSLRHEVETLLAYHDSATILPAIPSRNHVAGADQAPQPTLADAVLFSGDSLGADEETRKLLRFRLRAVTLVLALAITFLVLMDIVTGQWFELRTRVIGLSVLCACMALLRSNIPLDLRQLRIVEGVVLATIGLLAIMIEWWLMVEGAGSDDRAQTINANNWSYLSWTLLILVYGVFMPNRWQRATLFLLPAACVPYLVTWAICLWSAPVRMILDGEEKFGTRLPAPFVAALTSIYAAHIIHSARLDAIRARQFAQYHLVRLIGAGGMGEVYEAEHMLLKRPCAVKLIRRERSSDAYLLARFEREVKATAQLSHPNTIEVFDYGRTQEGRFYYVMELLPGMSLQELVDKHGPLSAGRVIYLLRQCCGALQEAHEADLIHRDIKPANVFAARRGGMDDVAKVLDFGLVGHTHVDAQLSGQQMIAGTPHYMAPEQALSSSQADARSDLYALGATAYFLLTGHPPFRGETVMQVLLMHARDAVVPPSHDTPTVPADLDDVVVRCLQKEPGDRYQSAVELERALANCQCVDEWSKQDAKNWWRGREINNAQD